MNANVDANVDANESANVNENAANEPDLASAELSAVVIAAREGDTDAYAEIVRRFEGMARGMGLRWLGTPQHAEDAVQDAFIEAYLALPQLREPAAFPGWFRRIVLKHCDRQLRTGRHERPLDDALPGLLRDIHRQAHLDDLDALYLRERVSSALEELPERQRVLSRLFYLEGYSQQDLVETLAMPLPTVKKQLFLARNRLRKEMQDMAEDRAEVTNDTSELSLRVQFFLALRGRDTRRIQQLVQTNPELLQARTEYAEIDNSHYWPLGYTALHYTVAVGDLPLTQTLVDLAADVNVMTRDKMATPLHVAVMQQRPEMVTYLLSVEANASAVNGNGMTALHIAAYRNDLASAQHLLAAGAAPSLKDSGGRTPLDWALHRGSAAVAAFLRDHGGKAAAKQLPLQALPSTAGPILETGIKIIDLFAPLARGGVNGLFTPLTGIGKVVTLEQLIELMARRYAGHTLFFGVEGAHYTGTDFAVEVRDVGLTQAVSLHFGPRDDAHALTTLVEQALISVEPNREMLIMADAAYADAAGLQAKFEQAAKGRTTLLWYGESTAGVEPEHFAHLESVIGFELWRALNGLWPSIDPVRSHTHAALISDRHAALIARAKRLLRRYDDLRIPIERDPRGLDALQTDADRADAIRANQLHTYLAQPLPIAELFTNTFGESVPLRDALDGLEAVLDGNARAALESDLRHIAGTRLYIRR